EPALPDLHERLQPLLGAGVERDLGVRQVDGAVAPLEVEPVGDLPARLVEGVAHLLHADLGHHVEAGHVAMLEPLGSVSETPKEAVCKTAAEATMVRTHPGPLKVEGCKGPGQQPYAARA